MDTRMHTAVRPSPAERARTVLAAAASVSVHWPIGVHGPIGLGDQSRVDLLGCHHDDRFGDVVLTLDPGSALVRAAREASEEVRRLILEAHRQRPCIRPLRP